MRIKSVQVLSIIRLIVIDSGKVWDQPLGTFPLTKVRFKDRDYHIITNDAGLRIGCVDSGWENFEREGTVRLLRVADENDPTLFGLTLPITSANQIDANKRKLVCGYLIKGSFYCSKCAEGKSMTYPNAIPISADNILPYSQDCHKCNLLLFDIARTKTGPDILFRRRSAQ